MATATAAASNGLTTAVNVPAAVVVPAQNSALATTTVGGAAAMLTRMNNNTTNFGQYYLRFLRHHSTRASPVTVQWLLQNYETAEGVSLPRSALYSHYLNHCLDYWLEPMNPASLQKYPDYSSGSVGGKSEPASAASNVYTCYSKFRSIRANTTVGSTAVPAVPVGFSRPMETTSTSFIKSEMPGPSSPASVYRTLTARPTSASLPTMVKPKLTGVFYKDDTSSSSFTTKPEASETSASLWRPWETSSSGGVGAQRTVSPCLYDWQGNDKLSTDPDLSTGGMESGPLTCLTDQGGENEDRLYFGSGSDQNFSFPRLTDLCQLVGIDLSPTSTSFPIDLSVESSNSDSNRIGKEITEREAILQFVKLYEQHCAEVYEAIITPQLEKLRNVWQRFWSPSDTLSRDLGQRETIGSNGGCGCETRLNKMQLALINSRKCLCQFVEVADRALYQTLLEIIIGDSLKSMPPSLLHTVRVMVKRVQHCLRSAIRHLSPTLINCKLTAISGFIKGLRRVIGLAHLSRAVAHVLNTPERLEQMRADICKLDLESIEAQGSWASDCLPSWTLFTEHSLLANFAVPSIDAASTFCRDDYVASFSHLRYRKSSSPGAVGAAATCVGGAMQSEGVFETAGCPFTMVQLHAELQHLLAANAPLTCWVAWLDRVVLRGLAGRVSGPKRANAARQLMLVWNYYSSLLIRELTLRSALSFGSCYLLRMLCDEYLSFRLEQVAASPLLTIFSRWNTSAPHAPEGCVCFDAAPANTSTSTMTATAVTTPTTVMVVNEGDAAATLLTTFNSMDEEREPMADISANGGRDTDNASPWEQSVSNTFYSCFDGTQTVADSLMLAPSTGLGAELWSTVPFGGGDMLPPSAFSAITGPPFAEELIAATNTSSITAATTPTSPPPPSVSPQMSMVPVFPDQFLSASPPPPQLVQHSTKGTEVGSRKAPSMRSGCEKDSGDSGVIAAGTALKINRKSVRVTIGKEEPPD
uniref:Transcription factor rfx3 n=1 Tax=Echinococcus granulosus TaxID=6210 RepID=A0A068WS57_ECHGR|nr:transcription factor rfx3 [Echinococcus granulosus]